MRPHELIERIEKRRNSIVIALAASNLDLDILPILYDALSQIGHVQRLDVLFYCRGGVINAARRIALLLHEHTDYLSFIIPHHCESAGTITALSGHEIVAGPVAIFSPIDPQLQASAASGNEGLSAISAEDIRLLKAMSQAWFGFDSHEAGHKSWSVLCDNIFPTTLTSFYRSMLELQLICTQLLALHLSKGSESKITEITNRLMSGYHSHSFALTRNDLEDCGLNINGDEITESLAWEMSRYFRDTVGSGARQSLDDDWTDVLIATRTVLWQRHHRKDGLISDWREGAWE